jgi:hypothetical protein
MAHRHDKYHAREKQARIRHVLMLEWDLLNGFGAADEYDSYIGTIYLMLLNERTNRKRIADHLLGLAINSMGLSDKPELREKCSGAAAALMLLRSEFAAN